MHACNGFGVLDRLVVDASAFSEKGAAADLREKGGGSSGRGGTPTVRVASAGSEGGSVYVAGSSVSGSDTEGGGDGDTSSSPARKKKGKAARKHAALTCIAWSFDGRFLVSGDDAGKLVVWSACAEPGHTAPLLALYGHKLGVTTCAFAPDGGAVFSSSLPVEPEIVAPSSANQSAVLNARMQRFRAGQARISRCARGASFRADPAPPRRCRAAKSWPLKPNIESNVENLTTEMSG